MLTYPKFWQHKHLLSYLLLPAASIYLIITKIKKLLTTTKKLPVPVLVVGNLTVGGTGKTPLVIWLVNFLTTQGYHPGIISRGYQGRASIYPQHVLATSSVIEVGDEALILRHHTECPIVIDPKRYRGAQTLIQEYHCDVIVSDDGLQHYALPQDITLAVLDGSRGFGNGWCLPAGPLRETSNRLQKVTFTIQNTTLANGLNADYNMQLQPVCFVNVKDPTQTRALDSFAGQKLHAVAGIGNPTQFFHTLHRLGITTIEHVFPDHSWYRNKDFSFTTDTVIMTEKDAVKCTSIATANFWYLLVTATITGDFAPQLLTKLKTRSNYYEV